MLVADTVVLLSAGTGIGILGSVLGIGGGVFSVPLLVLYFNVPIHAAITASSAVASVNVERGLANMRLGVFLELSTAAGSVIGAFAATYLPAVILQKIFAVILVPIAFLMWFGKENPADPEDIIPRDCGDLGSTFFDPAEKNHIHYTVKRPYPAFFISALAGSLSGLLGLGGGIIHVPTMNLLCSVPVKAAAATSNFMIGVSATASAVIFLKHGHLDTELTPYLIIGVLSGSFAGIRILHKTKSRNIKYFFALLMFLVAVKMFTGAGK